jgi:arylsulfatase A-like enzyme
VPRPTETPGRPNIVVILIDTLRPDHLGFYGYPRETAPFLRELASRSTVFLEAVSTSSATAPATASLFTGLYPTRHGVNRGFFAQKRELATVDQGGTGTLRLVRMPRDVKTLPELLRDTGYRTFGLAANINIGPEMGFDRGFDRFERLDLERITGAHQAEIIGDRPLRSASAEEVYERLLAWEKEIRSGAPYFLYLHLNDPHEPYHKRAPWYRHSLSPNDRAISAYDSEISSADRMLEKLYRRFELERNTLLFVLSDHGEAFGEHGLTSHPRSLYRVLNRILWMVSAPSLSVRTAAVVDRVSMVDVLPTLLDLVTPGEAPNRDGRPLRALLEGETPELSEALEERSVYAHRVAGPAKDRHESWAVMRGDWKLLEESGQLALYHTRADPEEKQDQLHAQPGVRAELEPELRAFQNQGREQGGEATEVQLDRATLERLKALGYADPTE